MGRVRRRLPLARRRRHRRRVVEVKSAVRALAHLGLERRDGPPELALGQDLPLRADGLDLVGRRSSQILDAVRGGAHVGDLGRI